MMRPSRDLRILQQRSLRRVVHLRVVAGDSLSPMIAPKSGMDHRSVDLLVGYVVIELDNLWAGTARSLFLSTAFRARDAGGKHVYLSKVPQSNSVSEALRHLGKRDVRWWRHRFLPRALGYLGASNLEQVEKALNASPGVFEHLHTFRNFYAHRGYGTREKVEISLRQLQFPRHYTATQALVSPRPARGRPRPQPLVLDWLDEMRTTIELLV